MSGILSGWCMDDHCLPSATSRGCPGTFSFGASCRCDCHKGKVSGRAREIARQDNLRAARREAEKRAPARDVSITPEAGQVAASTEGAAT